MNIKIFGGNPMDWPEGVEKVANEWLNNHPDIVIIKTSTELTKFNDFHNILTLTILYEEKDK